MKKTFLKRRSTWIFTTLLLVAVASGIVYWDQTAASASEVTTPVMQTAKVRTGDLVITANGGGSVIPNHQAELGFRSSGILNEINVAVGQSVTKGQVLASLDSNLQQAQLAQAEAAFQALFSESSLAQTKVTLANAEIASQAAIEDLQYLISPAVYFGEIELEKANQAILTLKNDGAATEEQKTAAQKVLDRTQASLLTAQQRYRVEYVPGTFSYTYIDPETNLEVATTIAPTPTDISLARAKVDATHFAVLDARAVLEIVQAGSPSISGPVVAVQGSETAKIEQARLNLENARLALENTRLIAPFDGVVINLDGIAGQTVNTAPLLTLATTQDLQVRFYLDETDLDKAVAGNKVAITFDAFPNMPLEGKITAVEQALQVIDGTPVIVSWASFTNPAKQAILSGMTVDVEVIGGEAKGALLLPVQALREIAPGSFAVFLIQADGSLKLTPVKVGLRDFANAEILSGLKAGDQVSTGTVETK